jgi:hypothetical protein
LFFTGICFLVAWEGGEEEQGRLGADVAALVDFLIVLVLFLWGTCLLVREVTIAC